MEKLTVEDRIMGRKEPLPKTDLQLKAFTAETKYKVNSIGKDNPSIMVGSFVDRILPIKIKQQIKNGEVVVEYNGLRIERIVEPTIKESLTVEEDVRKNRTADEEPPKPKRKRAK